MSRLFTPFPEITTNRLLLRKLRSDDANAIFALRTDEQVNQFLDRKLPETIDEVKAFIQNVNENIQKNDSLYWAITLIDSHQLVGTICLFCFSADNSTAEIGYELLPEFQGMGIMQEAAMEVTGFGFETLGLNSVEAYVHAENQPSVRLLEKLGFVPCGSGIDKLMVFKLDRKVIP